MRLLRTIIRRYKAILLTSFCLTILQANSISAASEAGSSFDTGIEAFQRGDFTAASRVISRYTDHPSKKLQAKAYIFAMQDEKDPDPELAPSTELKEFIITQSVTESFYKALSAKLHLMGYHPTSNARTGLTDLINLGEIDEDAYALYTLGLYYEGLLNPGSTKNLEKAKHKYAEARTKGYRPAMERFNIVSQLLDPEEGRGAAGEENESVWESASHARGGAGVAFRYEGSEVGDRGYARAGAGGAASIISGHTAGRFYGGIGSVISSMSGDSEQLHPQRMPIMVTSPTVSTVGGGATVTAASSRVSHEEGRGRTIATSTSIIREDEETIRRTELIRQKEIGDLYLAIRVGNKDALSTLEAQARSGDHLAEAYMSRLHMLDSLVKKDVSTADAYARKARGWIEEEARKGNAYAQTNLAWMYEEGTGGVAKDELEAVKWYRLAADQGNAQAQLNLGYMYRNGRGVVKDDAEALKWWRLAADQGDANAQCSLGWAYDTGSGVAKDDAEAEKWYRLAADQGFAGAQCNLGAMYQSVAKDNAEAVKWYRLAADQGDAVAQFNLGIMYYNGQGVAKDEAEAVKWYRLAANQEIALAQFNLGAMYHYGCGVTKDEAEAVKWYRLAADQEIANAQFNLGIMYHYGSGVAKDDTEAVKWFRLAADQGYATAKVALARLGV